MSYQQAQYKNKVRFGEDGDSLMMLIIVNVIVFILLMFLKIVYQLTYDKDVYETFYRTGIFDWFVLPADFKTLLFRPWVLATHFVSQDNIWFLTGDMLFLWAFGYLLRDLTGNRHIVPVFLYGCFTAAVLFLASSQMPQFRHIDYTYNGAGAGVMAIAVAATITAPQFRIFPMINGGIPIWILTLVYIVIDLTGVAGHGFPYVIAHLGGIIIGFIYTRQLQNGKDWSNWMYNFYNWFNALFSSSKQSGKQAVKKSGVQPFINKTGISQQRVDEILDKISQKGYQTLTQEEKEILKKAAENETL
ncbi:MAG: rhomboid family intramembrane serine protease [Lacibacter sp.]